MRHIFQGLWALSLVSATIIYLNLPVLVQSRAWTEPAVYLFTCVILLLQVFLSKPVLRLTRFEIAVLAFILYRIIRAACVPTVHIGILAEILFPVMLYYSFRLFTGAIGQEYSSRTLLLATLIPLVIYPVVIISDTASLSRTMTYLYSPNTSAYSILLAAQLTFVLPLAFWYFKKKTISATAINRVILALTLISIFILILSNGRSGWMGFLAGLGLTAYLILPASRLRKRIILCSCIVLLLLIPLFIAYKWDSSAGRMLIYKISFNILCDNFLFGIGEGQFSVQYSLYQSNHFASHDINSKEALLADNTGHAFNDPLELLVEQGLCGFLLFIAAILCLLIPILRSKQHRNKFAFTAPAACLLCISVASSFFYPFHLLPLIFYAASCLSLINEDLAVKKYVRISVIMQKTLRFGFVLIGLALSVYSVLWLQYRLKSDQAARLSKAGFKNQAVWIYTGLDKSCIKEGETMLAYGKELYKTGRLHAASGIFNKCKKYHTTRELYSLSASTFHELQQYDKAEKDYRTVLFMAPKRMRSRYDLMEHYLAINDTAMAVHWARSILHMPVKVPSPTIVRLRQKTDVLLKLLDQK